MADLGTVDASGWLLCGKTQKAWGWSAFGKTSCYHGDTTPKETPFFPPDECNNAQLVVVTCAYAYVLFQASNLISDGSELLLLVPSAAGLVGSIVLPVLGAVPDGMV